VELWYEKCARKVRLRLDQYTCEPVYQFKLLRSASIQENFDPLSEIPLFFFSFEGQKDPRGKAESFGHRDDGVKAGDLLSAFNVPPKISGNVPAFRGLL
jgi:hypothetical protein